VHEPPILSTQRRSVEAIVFGAHVRIKAALAKLVRESLPDSARFCFDDFDPEISEIPANNRCRI
jgi:hypothetical protein